jgi:hypothetical protein
MQLLTHLLFTPIKTDLITRILLKNTCWFDINEEHWLVVLVPCLDAAFCRIQETRPPWARGCVSVLRHLMLKAGEG